MEQRLADEVARARRSLGAELIPYGAYEAKLGDGEPVRIPVEGRSTRSS